MVISWKKSDANGANLQYLATGTHRLTSDTRVSVENADEKGSTLVISFANNDDVGDYICEVSSNPPATLRHHVSLMGRCHLFWVGSSAPIWCNFFFSVRPSVSILKPPEEVYRIFHGEELALVCRGQGDPEPTISWKREVREFSFKIILFFFFLKYFAIISMKIMEKQFDFLSMSNSYNVKPNFMHIVQCKVVNYCKLFMNNTLLRA